MSRRRYLSTNISTDPRVRDLAKRSEFAALLYSWMIPHAGDDATITSDPDTLHMTVVPGFTWRTEDDIREAVALMLEIGLLERVDDVTVRFPLKPFYRYQAYIGPARRAGTNGSADHNLVPGHGANGRDSAHAGADQRNAPTNGADQRNALEAGANGRDSAHVGADDEPEGVGADQRELAHVGANQRNAPDSGADQRAEAQKSTSVNVKFKSSVKDVLNQDSTSLGATRPAPARRRAHKGQDDEVQESGKVETPDDQAKLNRSGIFFDAVAAAGLPKPTMRAQDHKAFKESGLDPLMVARAYCLAASGTWDPGRKGWLKDNLSFQFVLSKIDAFQLWEANHPAPGQEPSRRNKPIAGLTSVFDDLNGTATQDLTVEHETPDTLRAPTDQPPTDDEHEVNEAIMTAAADTVTEEDVAF